MCEKCDTIEDFYNNHYLKNYRINYSYNFSEQSFIDDIFGMNMDDTILEYIRDDKNLKHEFIDNHVSLDEVISIKGEDNLFYRMDTDNILYKYKSEELMDRLSVDEVKKHFNLYSEDEILLLKI